MMRHHVHLHTLTSDSIKITTVAPTTNIEGTIYTACPMTNFLAISSATPAAAANQPISYNLIPISRIQNFTLVELPAPTPSQSITSSFENAQPPIARVDLKALKAREEAAIKKVRQQESFIGKGVTKEGQDLFNAFNRM